jgi:hypothetical protein
MACMWQTPAAGHIVFKTIKAEVLHEEEKRV